MLFAAGKGTRLDPLTLELPKPAVPVAHVPLAAFALACLGRAGITRVRANLHHLADALPPALEGHVPPGLRLDFAREDRLLGTGGGLRAAFAGDVPDGPLVVMNGDILFEPDLGRALEAHVRADAIATMVLRAHPDPARLGAVEIDPEGRVRRLLGRPDAAGPGLRAYMFTGVHVLAPRAFADLPAEGCIIRTAYRAWIDRGETVLGIVDDTPFADLGTPEAYLGANVAYAEGRALVAPPSTAPAIHPDARIGAGAVVASSVVGPGALVAPGVRLERCVVWPGAHATEDARDTIFTPRSTVRVGT